MLTVSAGRRAPRVPSQEQDPAARVCGRGCRLVRRAHAVPKVGWLLMYFPGLSPNARCAQSSRRRKRRCVRLSGRACTC